MTDGWTTKGKGALKFGVTDQKQPLNSEVIIYTLQDEELNKIREETGYMTISKEKYLHLKERGQSDKKISDELGIPMSKLNLIKQKWGLIGKLRTGAIDSLKDLPVPKIQVPKIQVPKIQVPEVHSDVAKPEESAKEIIAKDDSLDTLRYALEENAIVATVNPDQLSIPVTVDLWIVMDTEEETGPESIKGIFNEEIEAKLFLADRVLSKSINSDYLSIDHRQVAVKA